MQAIVRWLPRPQGYLDRGAQRANPAGGWKAHHDMRRYDREEHAMTHYARLPLDPPDDAIPIYTLPRAGFLAWLTHCDLWLEARGLPPLDVSDAATWYRAGLSVDDVVERQQGERP